MRNELEDLMINYITMREQSRKIKDVITDREDIIKLDASIDMLGLVIEGLEKLLSVPSHETPKVSINKEAKEHCKNQNGKEFCSYKHKDLLACHTRKCKHL